MKCISSSWMKWVWICDGLVPFSLHWYFSGDVWRVWVCCREGFELCSPDILHWDASSRCISLSLLSQGVSSSRALRHLSAFMPWVRALSPSVNASTFRNAQVRLILAVFPPLAQCTSHQRQCPGGSHLSMWLWVLAGRRRRCVFRSCLSNPTVDIVKSLICVNDCGSCLFVALLF